MIDERFDFFGIYTVVIGVEYNAERCNMVYAIFDQSIHGQICRKIGAHAQRENAKYSTGFLVVV
jgi:hypothetical protein